jgi:hypothetical protein
VPSATRGSRYRLPVTVWVRCLRGRSRLQYGRPAHTRQAPAGSGSVTSRPRARFSAAARSSPRKPARSPVPLGSRTSRPPFLDIGHDTRNELGQSSSSVQASVRVRPPRGLQGPGVPHRRDPSAQRVSHGRRLDRGRTHRWAWRCTAGSGSRCYGSSRRGAHAPRPLTPPYIRFRIRRFMSSGLNAGVCRGAIQVHVDQRTSSETRSSCAWHPRATTIRG